MATLTKHARIEAECYACGAKINAGDPCGSYRERATCLAEARRLNTMYPWRIECAKCATARIERAAGVTR